MSRLISNLMASSAFLTEGSTNGFPASSRYAPTPRFILLGLESFLKASFTPMMASGGPISTPDQKLKQQPVVSQFL